MQSPFGYKFSFSEVHRSSVRPSVNGGILERGVQTPAQSFPCPWTALCQPAETLPSRLASSAVLHQHTPAWPLWAPHKYTVSCAPVSGSHTCDARGPQVPLHVRPPPCELCSLVCLCALPAHPRWGTAVCLQCPPCRWGTAVCLQCPPCWWWTAVSLQRGALINEPPSDVRSKSVCGRIVRALRPVLGAQIHACPSLEPSTRGQRVSVQGCSRRLGCLALVPGLLGSVGRS